jgi:hypothetical protein
MNTVSILKACYIVLLPMLVALSSNVNAQTVNGFEGKAKSRVTARAITFVNSDGGAIRTTNNGSSWETLDAKSVDNVKSGIERELAKQQAIVPTTANVSVSPNPTMGLTTVNYEMSQPGEVSITLHDSRGVEILRQVEGMRSAGITSSTINASQVANGTYYYSIVINGMTTGSGKVVVAH